jgi:hypothetical protein
MTIRKRRLTRKGHLLIKRGSNKAVANLLGLTMLEVKRNAKHFGMTDTEVLEQMVQDKLKRGVIRQVG